MFRFLLRSVNIVMRGAGHPSPRMKAVSVNELVAEIAAYYDPEQQDSIGLRRTAARREMAAYLRRS